MSKEEYRVLKLHPKPDEAIAFKIDETIFYIKMIRGKYTISMPEKVRAVRFRVQGDWMPEEKLNLFREINDKNS
jgi:hypothetical protein